jgi:PilZ domain-containing protein
MNARRASWAAAAGALQHVGAGPAAAEGYLQFSPQSGVNSTWILAVLAVVAAGVLLHLANRVLQTRLHTRRERVPVQKANRRQRADFQKRAGKLGFRIAEVKTLRLIANKLAAHDPDSLLSTDAGRERLATDVAKRIRRRQREIEFLGGISDKLDLMREREIHERATIRVEGDLPVWIIKKADEDSLSEDEEDMFADEEQVAGRLLDLSEGGAAVCAELEVRAGDRVELWSRDPDIEIPPITAGILQVGHRPGESVPVFHVHFIDPPLEELRIALQALQTGRGGHL